MRSCDASPRTGLVRSGFLVCGFVICVALAACSGGEDSSPEPASSATTSVSSPAAEQPAPQSTVVAPPSDPPVVESASEEPGTDIAPEVATIDPVVFNDDFSTSIAPIFAQGCASCHNAGGPGAIHWQLETAGDLADTHEWISGVVSTGYMPPWPSSDLSLDFHDNRSLRSDEIEAIAQWSAAGGPLDVDASSPVSSPDGIATLDADAEIGPHEPYQGSVATADDYRCLIYDLELTERRWLQGFEFVPDQTQIVHHAIGYLAPASAMQRAQQLSDRDPIGGWQCYGGSGLDDGDELFLGWAPGQLPTQFPEGSGIPVEPGQFVVLQIHYHFDTDDAPVDASTLRLDWADGAGLDPILFDEFLGPAEIPCSTNESGPLCDRDAALARAYERFGIEGVLADGINRICGVRPADFADMTNGIASSSCTIPVRDTGEIVSVFGHEHEIGKSIRMTLNAGQADERILLDIPDWDFDWQYNYYPTESIMVERGDTILLECSWDRSRRAPDLEPAYVLWADGTNDEMCFATMAVRADGSQSSDYETVPDGAGDIGFVLPDALAACMSEGGVSLGALPERDEIDATVERLFECADPAEVGDLLVGPIATNFDGLASQESIDCIANKMATPDGARSLLLYLQPDASEAERVPVGEIVADCVSLSEAIVAFGFPIPESSFECIDEAGRDLLVQATVEGGLPEAQTLFATINPCLSAG